MAKLIDIKTGKEYQPQKGQIVPQRTYRVVSIGNMVERTGRDLLIKRGLVIEEYDGEVVEESHGLAAHLLSALSRRRRARPVRKTHSVKKAERFEETYQPPKYGEHYTNPDNYSCDS